MNTHVTNLWRMLVNYLCLKCTQQTILILVLTCIRLSYETNNNNEALWPLRYHQSPWLEKSFLIRDDTTAKHTNTEIDTRHKCDENSQQDYGRSSFSSCQTEGECTYVPSPSCSREIERRRFEREEQNISIDEILAHNYINPPRRILPNKDGRKRQMPSEFEKCHYLTDTLITNMCSSNWQHVRRELIERFRLRNCRRFSLEKALTSDLYQQVINSKNCSNILRELLILDNLVEELACEYESILHRYDCDAKWSVKWTCKDCRLAYREWLCSTYIPYHVNGLLIKPCQSICEQVEQKCPHLHPYGKGQYAGEPVFLCIDPNIPFNQEITPNIPFGASEWCYDSCELEPCFNEYDEAPVVDCESNLPKTTTTITSLDVSISENSDSIPIEPEDESIQMFEEEFENITGQLNSTFSEQNDLIDESTISSSSSLDSEELPHIETTTEYDWSTNSAIIDSAEAEFEREVQTLRKNGNLNDLDVLENTQIDSSTSLATLAQNELTTSKYPSWSSLDEDYNYIIQTSSSSKQQESSKQSQSIQYLELEPLYKSSENSDADPSRNGGVAVGVTHEKSQLYQHHQHEQHEQSQAVPTKVISTTEVFQEILENALSPTSASIAIDESVPVLESLKELTLVDDDIQTIVRSNVRKVDNWRNQANKQTIARVDETAAASKVNTVEEAVDLSGSNHYRHSRSHRTSNKNSATIKKQQKQQKQKQDDEEEEEKDDDEEEEEEEEEEKEQQQQHHYQQKKELNINEFVQEQVTNSFTKEKKNFQHKIQVCTCILFSVVLLQSF